MTLPEHALFSFSPEAKGSSSKPRTAEARFQRTLVGVGWLLAVPLPCSC